MKKIIKHYVKEYSPDSIGSEVNEREIESRESFIPADRTFCYQFFDRKFVLDDDGELYTGKYINHSPFYYEGEIWDIEEARERGTCALVENMRINNFKRIVHTKYNTAHVLHDEDIVVSQFKRNVQ